jgi:uncharacterized protein (UPF0261 family)
MEPVERACVIVIGTMDTKGDEVSYLCAQLRSHGLIARTMDVGISSAPSSPADIGREEIAAQSAFDIAALLTRSEGKLKAMDAMARGALLLAGEKFSAGEIAGIIALGGGVGTWIGMKVMRGLAFGLPKIMISTLPFDIRPSLGSRDIMIVPSVTDILGLNPILRKVLQNAAAAMAGMVALDNPPEPAKKLIGITALGVTTPLVTACKEILEAKGYEIAAFHGVGIGGIIFEEWVQTGIFSGILDLTPHDVNNFLFDGISPPYPGRLESAARKNIPQVVAPGGLDFVSRGPVEALSAEDRRKKHYRHSPMFTHVRVTSDEMKAVANLVADKLNMSRGSIAVAIPLHGFSYQGHAEGHLADHDSDMTFVRILKQKLRKDIPVIEVDAHINDSLFAQAVCSLLFELIDRP